MRLWYPFPELRSRDEQTYTTFARTLNREGVTGLQRLSAAYVADTQRLDPPPTRVGYPALIAVVQSATGLDGYVAGSWVSTLASVATLAVIAALGVELLGIEGAIVGTLLLAVFVPDLVIARRAWVDALSSFLTCLMLLATVRYAGRRHESSALALLALAGFFFALTKETSAIVWALCLGWLLVVDVRRAVRAIGISVVAGVVALLVLTWVSGGLATLWNIQSQFSRFHTANPYAQEYQNGPSLWLVAGFFITSPLTTVLVVIGLPALWLRREGQTHSGMWMIGGFAVLFLLLPFVLPNWLSLRFASPAFGPMMLTAATLTSVGAERFARSLRGGRSAVVMTALT